MEEEQTHLDAFELYFKLRQEGNGKTKSVAGVASEYNRSESTIFEWKKKLHWDDREAIRSSEINSNIQKKTNSTIIDNKSKYLSYGHAILNKVIVKKPDGTFDINLDIKNVSDFEKVTKLCLLLQGEDTERTSINTNKNQFNNETQKSILEEGSNE